MQSFTHMYIHTSHLLLQTSFVFREWDTKKPIHTNPSLDYLAPEYVLTKSCNQPSDVFSYGMLCYAVYNEGKPLFENHNNMLSFKSNAEQVSCVYVCVWAFFSSFPH